MQALGLVRHLGTSRIEAAWADLSPARLPLSHSIKVAGAGFDNAPFALSCGVSHRRCIRNADGSHLISDPSLRSSETMRWAIFGLRAAFLNQRHRHQTDLHDHLTYSGIKRRISCSPR